MSTSKLGGTLFSNTIWLNLVVVNCYNLSGMVETQMTRPIKPGITKKTCDLSTTNTINQFLHHCFPISPYVIPPKPRQWSLNIRGSRGARDHQWRPTWWLFRWKPPAAASRRGSWAAWLLGCPFFWGELEREYWVEYWGSCNGKWR
jgi:hypothetical protein